LVLCKTWSKLASIFMRLYVSYSVYTKPIRLF
jgi:hypothetical protein